MKLRSSKSVGQSDVSTQQFHFPTALPPPIPSHPLSSGLNSAFTYDGKCSMFMVDIISGFACINSWCELLSSCLFLYRAVCQLSGKARWFRISGLKLVFFIIQQTLMKDKQPQLKGSL